MNMNLTIQLPKRSNFLILMFLLAFFLIFTKTPAHCSDTGHDPLRQVGRQQDGTIVLPTNRILKPAGRQVEFEGRPNGIALSPDSTTVALLNAAKNNIIVMDSRTGEIKQMFAPDGFKASSNGIVYSKDGKFLFASQSDGYLLIANVLSDNTLFLEQQLALPLSKIHYPGADYNPNPIGLAVSDDGKTLYIALSRNNSLAVFDISTRAVLKEIAVGNVPTGVVVGNGKVYVSNRGGRPARQGDFTVDSSGTPIVADPISGGAITGSVSVVDIKTNQQITSIPVGLHPSGLLVAGKRLFVANSNSDNVSVIDIESDKVIKTISIKPFENALFGSSPNALAIMDNRLVVSLGAGNCLAVYALGHRFGGVEFQGLIPTGWYPSGIAVDNEKRQLLVANTKGVGALGPATIWKSPAGSPPTQGKGHNSMAYMGSASMIEFPDYHTLQAHTRQTLENNSWIALSRRKDAKKTGTKKPDPVPLPEKTGDPSVFKHVFYIIKENRTYDQIFGDFKDKNKKPKGNGDPKLVQFGQDVTPNHHALARQFMLFDNLYDSGSISSEGHQWITQAFVVDYLAKDLTTYARTYPFNGGDALVYAPSGFLWENALNLGKSVRVYGEYANGLTANGLEMGPWVNPTVKPPAKVKAPWLGGGVTNAGSWAAFWQDTSILAGEETGELHVKLRSSSDIPSLDRLLCREFPPFNTGIPDQYRVQVWMKEFDRYVADNNLPNLSVMLICQDHTQGNLPGYPTPEAMVADNDLALGRIVEKISHSPYWKNSIIFIIEDDAQNGVDHVDGHRTLGFVISPYTRREVVNSNYYTQLDITRTIEHILGLPPMTQMDMAIDPRAMKAVFTDKPDFTPFKAKPARIPLDTMNKPLTAMKGLEKEWALAMAEQNFSKPDAADEDMLNRVIWYTVKGYDTPYPGDPRVLSPHELESEHGRKIDDD
ncbi:alkaline phosphatase family protein [Desulfobacula toluolica]|uniref:alkaline phosphatase family protein n=1 Tax=Desulfobacula toluolica TaxID=28223 RepID=UPI0002E7D79F|nr:alkaline phosphatase family protein [Desulfobacula toluolica]